MPVQPSQPSNVRPRRRVPVVTWVGLVGTALLALIGFASSGFWSAVMLVALAVLVTAVYGVLFRRTTWLRLPRKRSAAAIGAGVAFVVMVGSTAAFGATHSSPSEPVVAAASHAAPQAFVAERTPTASPSRAADPTPTPTPTPVVVTTTTTETVSVPFAAQTVQDATRAKGTSVVTTPGRAGVETKTWRITTTDGVETGRTLVSDTVTTPPTAQVTSVGTYVAPAPAQPTCTNGTYVNTAGNTVCRPEVSNTAPSGATAKCGDGTYSFSQSRRGTCSSHGGVAAWL